MAGEGALVPPRRLGRDMVHGDDNDCYYYNSQISQSLPNGVNEKLSVYEWLVKEGALVSMETGSR